MIICLLSFVADKNQRKKQKKSKNKRVKNGAAAGVGNGSKQLETPLRKGENGDQLQCCDVCTCGGVGGDQDDKCPDIIQSNPPIFTHFGQGLICENCVGENGGCHVRLCQDLDPDMVQTSTAI